jgi:hypothetical protein
LFGWTVLWVGPRDQAIAAAATLGAFLTAGKVVAITAGLTLGGDPWIVGAAVFLPDFGALLFFYPFTTSGIDHLGRWSRRIRESVTRARKRHEDREGLIARHGPWGLFLVSVIPVGFYSPLVISALGQVLGFRPRQILWPVGAAMLVMTSAWTLTLNASLDQAAALDPRLPIVLSLGLLVVFLGKSLVKRLFRRPEAPVDATVETVPPGPGPL